MFRSPSTERAVERYPSFVTGTVPGTLHALEFAKTEVVSMKVSIRAGLVALTAAAAVALAGCETMNDVAQNPDKEKTRKGAAYGAAAGAAIGLITGGHDKFQAAMIGAAAGALAGGAVGYYMDKQEAKLREQMAGTGVDVVRKGDNITLDVPGGVTFGFNSADLNSKFYPTLDKVASTLSEYNKTVIEVAGHTDNVGSDAYNQQLSERRADSVASYLSGRGVQRGRLVTVGAGELHPIATNDTDAGRAQNRRVEITIVPVTEENVEKAKRG